MMEGISAELCLMGVATDAVQVTQGGTPFCVSDFHAFGRDQTSGGEGLYHQLIRSRGHAENRPISAAVMGTGNSSVFRHTLRVPKTHTLSRSCARRDDR